jgi:hypothetical protein
MCYIVFIRDYCHTLLGTSRVAIVYYIVHEEGRWGVGCAQRDTRLRGI